LASAPFTVQWLLNGSVISTIPVPALGNDCAANAAPYSEPLVLIPPLGDNFLEFVMSNAVGQASQLIVVQVLAGGASPAAPANGLVIGEAANLVSSLSDARYYRARGRTCYVKCFREFVIGPRVCRRYCGPF